MRVSALGGDRGVLRGRGGLAGEGVHGVGVGGVGRGLMGGSLLLLLGRVYVLSKSYLESSRSCRRAIADMWV